MSSLALFTVSEYVTARTARYAKIFVDVYNRSGKTASCSLKTFDREKLKA